jgi:hypothetical protein
MDAPEDRSKALNEHMSSGFAPRADIVAACRHVRFVPQAVIPEDQLFASHRRIWRHLLAGDTGPALQLWRDAM